MKQIILKSLQLFLYSIIAYIVLCGILTLVHVNGRTAASWATSYMHGTGDHEYCTFKDLDTSTTRYDYIALGSSHAMHGYDPRIFRKSGYTLFNFGSSNQHSKISYMLAKYYLDLPEKPIFLIDVYHAVFQGEVLESNFRFMANIPDPAAAFSLVRSDPDLRLFNAFATRLFRNEKKPNTGCYSYVENGYCQNTDTISNSLAPYDPAPSINEERIAMLDKLLSLLESRNCRYILVAHPMTKAEGFAGVHQHFIKSLQPVIDKHNAVFIDQTLETYLNDKEHFYNQTHMNQAGVELYNARLIPLLKETGFVPKEK
ncbi:MAG: hypothetical protein SGI87_06880 [Flavobacteriales bacterium]|nr:hypothetical protein [Flavobacteriales bacterium]